MPTIKLGGRELKVRPATLGMLKRDLIPLRAKLQASQTEEDTIDVVLDQLLVYLGRNEGVTADWLLDNTPADAHDLLARVREAAGHEASTGEALSP
jgi:hypothetical protein